MKDRSQSRQTMEEKLLVEMKQPWLRNEYFAFGCQVIQVIWGENVYELRPPSHFHGCLIHSPVFDNARSRDSVRGIHV